MKKILLIASIVTMSAIAVGCGSKTQTTAVVEETTPAVLVKTEAATLTEVAQTVDFTSSLEPNKKTFISPSMAVRIEDILVEVGDRVKEGQVLVQMDKNQFNQSQLQMKNAEINLARMQAVYEVGGMAKQNIDELETSIGVMEESIQNLEKNLQLRAPFSGVVTGRYNEVGDLFVMGANRDGGVGILQIMQTNPLKAIVAVQEQYLPFVKDGMKVDIKADVYPDQVFTGTVSLVYPSIDPATRTFNVEIKVPNANSTLKPGMSSRTTFDMGARNSVVISDLAVQKQSGINERYVYVIKDGKAERRTVTLGRQVGDKIEVLSGVEAGEEVAVTSLSKLMNGTEVQVSNN